MSGGGLIGAVVGGVAGFFMGGPVGALYGASLGYSVGSLIDPVTPDTPTPGLPDVGKTVMVSTVGGPIPQILGTNKISGHLLWYGNERTVEITQTSEVAGGGKGGGGSETVTTVTGYNYYMTWCLGICSGPVSTLVTVLKNDQDIVWEGELDCPATGGEETIALEGMGSCTFYFGTNDQVANSTLSALMEDSTLNTPYRNFCWALMDDCLIGEYPRTPTLSFVIRNQPEYDFSISNIIQEYDYNPSHAIWHVLHTIAGLPETWLNETAFSQIADTLSTEYRGISMQFTNQNTALQFIETINSHIDGIITYSSEGKFSPKLIRDDYDVDSVPSIDEEVLLEEPTFTRKSWNDTINELKVQYSEIINVVRDKIVYGEVYAVGNNSEDEFGDTNANLGEHVFVVVEDMRKAKIVSATSFLGASVAIDTNGYAWYCGVNTYGQFGFGNTDSLTEWTKLTSVWDDVIIGNDGGVNIAYMSDGYLFGCGYNYRGQLGLDDSPGQNHISTPTQESTGRAWQSVSLGTIYSVAVGTDSKLYVTGSNIYACGYSNRTFFEFTEDANEYTGWTEVYHAGNTVFARRNGTWYACGQNNAGEMGCGLSGTHYTNWQSLSGGMGAFFTKIRLGHSSGAVGWGKNTIALSSDGTIWAAGDNHLGQLGQGDTLDRNYFVQVGTADNWVDIGTNMNNFWALNSDGEIWGCGRMQPKIAYGTFFGYTTDASSDVLVQETAKNSWTSVGSIYSAHHTLAIKK
jgi:alpha-tubulin suppressor-like RCC1 family protein